MIFDSHTHLFDESYNEDIDEVMKRAKENGVTYFMVPGDNLDNSLKAIAFAHKYQGAYAAVGVHPEEVDKAPIEEVISKLKEYSKDSKVKAIGEIGLDYHFEEDEQKRKKQQLFFIEQIKLANELKLPVIVHSRDAHQITLEILKNYRPQYGFVLHCYSSSVEMLKDFLTLGAYIGLDGPVTFKNALTPKEVARQVPLNKLLIETDSPYLAPVPNRGKRNESSFIVEVCATIAYLKGLPIKEIESATFDNACRLFGIEYGKD